MNPFDSDIPNPLPKEALLRFLESSRTGPQKLEDGHFAGTEDCSGPASYMRVAMGTCDRSTAQKLLTHASTCEGCGEVLAQCLASLDGNASEEESVAIAEMAVSQAEWQTPMARDLAATHAKTRKGILAGGASGKWFAACSAAAAVATVAALFAWQAHRDSPERQLALAYSQQRTLELRIPDAAYAGMKSDGRTRGNQGNHEPAALLGARAALARKLEKSPEDAHWLQLQARADLLEAHYDSAVDVLDRLLASTPVTAELLSDAGSAYFQRGIVSGSEIDKSTALDYLRRADGLAPTDSEILFNEAIVMEDRGQLISAVEVWNRYMRVEHDSQWAAEGKIKLTALEQTLNRLKSHESRMEKMLSTPGEMRALAMDKGKLGVLDEELSSIQLNEIVSLAYPLIGDDRHRSLADAEARGSPCIDRCPEARILLRAISKSLELNHHDFWLSDLVPPDIDSLPAPDAGTYSLAIRQVAQASSEDALGSPFDGASLATRALASFHRLAEKNYKSSPLATAGRSGEIRSETERLFALQRAADFKGCRESSKSLHALPVSAHGASLYPWIETVQRITEWICDDTQETREPVHGLLLRASQLAKDNNYPQLSSRIQARVADQAQNAHDSETAERLCLLNLRSLYATDAPAIRIFNTIGTLMYVEATSQRPYMAAGVLEEMIGWVKLAGSDSIAATLRMNLAQEQMRLGQPALAEQQLKLAYAESVSSSSKDAANNLSEAEISLARLMLEKGDKKEAAAYLEKAALASARNSDYWEQRAYIAVQGQLDLEQGDLAAAEKKLIAYLKESERSVSIGMSAEEAVKFAKQDRELYAELAATWLEEGQPPQKVLALWERYRLRLAGLPTTRCSDGAIDCEQADLARADSLLQDQTIVGQIVLMDRVLIYQAGKDGVSWTRHNIAHQEVMDAAHALERSVSLPLTSAQTAERAGSSLSHMLLPAFPSSGSKGGGATTTLLLEPDPELESVPWPVLPTSAGPLGLAYPLAEVRTVLEDLSVNQRKESTGNSRGKQGSDDRSLLIGASFSSGNEPPLPEVLDEIRDVKQFLQEPQVLLGKDATRDRVAEAIESAGLIHFSGHATQNSNGTELRLAANSSRDVTPWVDGTFLRQHPPRKCRLAVLAACSTGSRSSYSWEDPLKDIVEILGSEGVPNVVATRWQIDSASSVPFMNSFYQAIAKGNTVADALTLARRSQFNSFSYSNPYYWGAYYLTSKPIDRYGEELHASFQQVREKSQERER